jgi:hypothetical protein
MGQFDGEMQDLLLSITTQIIGKTLSTKTARVLSQQLADIDTNKVKATTPIYGSAQVVAGSQIYHPLFDSYTNTPGITDHFVIDERDIFSPVHEQYVETAKRFKNIKPLEFEVYVHQQEPVRYSLLGTENDIDITSPETRQILSSVRRKLVERDGRKVDDVLAEIAQRTRPGAIRIAAETPETYTTNPVSKIPQKEP